MPSDKPSTYLLFPLNSVCVCVCVCVSVYLSVCQSMHVHMKVIGRLAGISSLCWSQELNSGPQAWWQVSLLDKPSHGLFTVCLKPQP